MEIPRAACRLGSFRVFSVFRGDFIGYSRIGYATETLPKRALEALLVDECARGRVSRGKVAELLGLSFHETEDLFRTHGVPYPIKTSTDDAFDNASLPRGR